jgi:hypothetical protein
MAYFTGTSGVTLANLGAYKIVNGAPDTGTPLTNSGQLSSIGYSWGSFSDSAGSIDYYSVYFFFSASSLNVSGSTYTNPTQYAGCRVDDKIINITDVANLYAIEVTFPERYESTSGTMTYTSEIVLKTNDEDVSLSKTISIAHQYCQIAS